MACTSRSESPRYIPIGIGGPMIVPSGRRPSRITVMISASVQLPIPVSMSGVRLGALAVNSGTS
jgi:hypothetical protein